MFSILNNKDGSTFLKTLIKKIKTHLTVLLREEVQTKCLMLLKLNISY